MYSSIHIVYLQLHKGGGGKPKGRTVQKRGLFTKERGYY